MSFKRYRIIFILIFMLTSDGNCGTYAENANDKETTKQHMMPNEMENAQSDNKEGARALFPRLEYTNEWTPVGRGDPLKDPTYDYMPPVLDRVRYWAEGTSNKNKNDILLLGVPSKKLSPINKKEKYTYGPVKRTYYSMPYQSHFSSQQQQQQHQQYHPQRLPPPQHSMMSTHHYNHHQYQQQNQQQQQQFHGWKTQNNVYQTEPRPENSIHHKTVVRPIVTTSQTQHPSTVPFLPTIPPISNSHEEYSSSTPTSPMSMMSTTTTVEVKHHNSKPTTTAAITLSSVRSSSNSGDKETAKPLLHSILRTESAAPFTKKPSSVYQIDFKSPNIYNPEAINSMATASSTTAFVPTQPTKPSVRPVLLKATTKISPPSAMMMTISTAERDQQKHYVQPDMHVGWPVYNLIIEGHSKVKNYGLKNDDPLEQMMPKIRPIQGKDNPIVERVTSPNDAPEYVKSQQSSMSHQHGENKKHSSNGKQQPAMTMTSLLSLLDGSFGNFLTTEEENRNQYERMRKARSVADDDNGKQERVVGVSFEVDERPQVYRKGSVISESLWPFEAADTSR